jgi:hypothetical protein
MANLKNYDKIDEIIAGLKLWPALFAPELDMREWRRFVIKVIICILCLKVKYAGNKQRIFRDKLKNDTNLVEQYANLKLVLSHQYKNDREAHLEAKKNFIMN